MDNKSGLIYVGRELKLMTPMEFDLEQVWEYRQEFLDACEHLNGCGPLSKSGSAKEWLDATMSYADPETVPEGLVQATQFMATRRSDGRMVGMIQIRHSLNEYTEQYIGHIGYSVRPSERNKGYAKYMLRLALVFCRELGLDKVLITCEPKNEASRRTILANGGQYETTVYKQDEDIYLQRYWIKL